MHGQTNTGNNKIGERTSLLMCFPCIFNWILWTTQDLSFTNHIIWKWIYLIGINHRSNRQNLRSKWNSNETFKHRPTDKQVRKLSSFHHYVVIKFPMRSNTNNNKSSIQKFRNKWCVTDANRSTKKTAWTAWGIEHLWTSKFNVHW